MRANPELRSHQDTLRALGRQEADREMGNANRALIQAEHRLDRLGDADGVGDVVREIRAALKSARWSLHDLPAVPVPTTEEGTS